ncbi:hypothetical protein NKH77_48640 [Streptomyces sp. M19]
MAELLGAVPAEHPLTAVVHTAGTLDDGMLTDLTRSGWTPSWARRSTRR